MSYLDIETLTLSNFISKFFDFWLIEYKTFAAKQTPMWTYLI